MINMYKNSKISMECKSRQSPYLKMQYRRQQSEKTTVSRIESRSPGDDQRPKLIFFSKNFFFSFLSSIAKIIFKFDRHSVSSVTSKIFQLRRLVSSITTTISFSIRDKVSFLVSRQGLASSTPMMSSSISCPAPPALLPNV